MNAKLQSLNLQNRRCWPRKRSRYRFTLHCVKFGLLVILNKGPYRRYFHFRDHQ